MSPEILHMMNITSPSIAQPIASDGGNGESENFENALDAFQEAVQDGQSVAHDNASAAKEKFIQIFTGQTSGQRANLDAIYLPVRQNSLRKIEEIATDNHPLRPTSSKIWTLETKRLNLRLIEKMVIPIEANEIQHIDRAPRLAVTLADPSDVEKKESDSQPRTFFADLSHFPADFGRNHSGEIFILHEAQSSAVMITSLRAIFESTHDNRSDGGSAFRHLSFDPPPLNFRALAVNFKFDEHNSVRCLLSDERQGISISLSASSLEVKDSIDMDKHVLVRNLEGQGVHVERIRTHLRTEGSRDEEHSGAIQGSSAQKNKSVAELIGRIEPLFDDGNDEDSTRKRRRQTRQQDDRTSFHLP